MRKEKINITAKFTKLNEARLSLYMPISFYSFSKVEYSEDPLMEEEYEKLLFFYKNKYYKTNKEILAVFPCYYLKENYIFNKVDFTSIKNDDDILLEKKVNKKTKLSPKESHVKFYTNIINLLKDKNGVHPLVMAPIPLVDSNPESVPYLSYENISANIYTQLSEFFLKEFQKEEYKEVKYLLVSDLTFARKIFKDIKFPGSFRDTIYNIYETNFFGRYLRIMVIPTPLQFEDYEEKCYEVVKEFFDIIQNIKEFPKINTIIIKKEKQLLEILENINSLEESKRILSFDTETTGLNPQYHNQKLIAAGFSDGKKSYIFLVDHPKYQNRKDIGVKLLKLFFENYNGTLVFQNSKFDLKWLKKYLGYFPKQKFYDTLLIDHWLNENFGTISKKLNLSPGILSMDNQIVRYLNIISHKNMLKKYLDNIEPENPFDIPKTEERKNLTIKELREVIQKITADMIEPYSGQYAKIPLFPLLKYLSKDCWSTKNIFDKMIELVLKENNNILPKVIEDLHEKQSRSIAEMEYEGAPINYDIIIEQIKKCNKIIETTKENLYKELPEDLNIESPKQLIDYFIKVLQITPEELRDPEDPTKFSVDEEVLEKFSEKYSWMKDLILYKKAVKARNTYLIPFIYHSYKGKIYFNLNITGTATGRLSSENPNMQNIPKYLGDKENKILIKQVFEVPDDRILVDLDFKNAEVKVLTAYCKDEKLIDAINKDKDIHCYSASLVYNIPYEDLYEAYLIKEKKINKKETDYHKKLQKLRSKAKSTTFGIIYGIGPHGLAKQLELDKKPDDEIIKNKIKYDIWKKEELEKEATLLLNRILNDIYSELSKTIEESDREVLINGFGESLFGRRRRYTFTIAKEISNILKEYYKNIPINMIKNFIQNKRSFRQNLNFKVQSSTSDYMQYFISFLFDELKDNKELDLKLYFTVHDSLVFSIKDSENNKKTLEKILDYIMFNKLRELSDKLPVDIGYSIDYSRRYCDDR